ITALHCGSACSATSFQHVSLRFVASIPSKLEQILNSAWSKHGRQPVAVLRRADDQ
ncbi:unnamed protein product, partial [Pylaiella littoralis]